jgi:hypothetical protein
VSAEYSNPTGWPLRPHSMTQVAHPLGGLGHVARALEPGAVSLTPTALVELPGEDAALLLAVGHFEHPDLSSFRGLERAGQAR